MKKYPVLGMVWCIHYSEFWNMKPQKEIIPNIIIVFALYI